ncbi:unnamed protein product [Moneuplotes crassus]|uniref:Thioredoxin domain-containing protein n=1 Tax=Euplotes crassus TaxID=5936 RepID=A0AAD1XRX6_EUPCR|nr:unnamed protein product [Moneuplotes crassus]
MARVWDLFIPCLILATIEATKANVDNKIQKVYSVQYLESISSNYPFTIVFVGNIEQGDRYYEKFKEFVDEYSKVPKIQFVALNNQTFQTSIFSDFNKEDPFSLYIIKQGGRAFRYNSEEFDLNRVTSFCSKIISKNLDMVPSHKQKCLLPPFTQKDFDEIYEEAGAYIVINEVDSTTLHEKLEIGCLILDAVYSTGAKLSAFFINENTPRAEYFSTFPPFKPSVKRDTLNTRVYIIDTSTLNGDRMVRSYPPGKEYTSEGIKQFIEQFIQDKQDDFDYELDL